MYLQAEVSRCSANSIRSGGLGCFQTVGQEPSSVVVCCIGSALCVCVQYVCMAFWLVSMDYNNVYVV